MYSYVLIACYFDTACHSHVPPSMLRSWNCGGPNVHSQRCRYYSTLVRCPARHVRHVGYHEHHFQSEAGWFPGTAKILKRRAARFSCPLAFHKSHQLSDSAPKPLDILGASTTISVHSLRLSPASLIGPGLPLLESRKPMWVAHRAFPAATGSTPKHAHRLLALSLPRTK